MTHAIQVALIAGALHASVLVLAQTVINPRCWAVLRQLLTGKAG